MATTTPGATGNSLDGLDASTGMSSWAPDLLFADLDHKTSLSVIDTMLTHEAFEGHPQDQYEWMLAGSDHLVEEAVKMDDRGMAADAQAMLLQLSERITELRREMGQVDGDAAADMSESVAHLTSIQTAVLAAATNPNLAVGSAMGPINIANSSQETRKKEEKEKTAKEATLQKDMYYAAATAAAVGTGGMLMATTVLTDNQLFEYAKNKVANLQEKTNEKFNQDTANMSEEDKDDLVVESTVDQGDVITATSADLDTLRQQVEDLDIAPEEKEKLQEFLTQESADYQKFGEYVSEIDVGTYRGHSINAAFAELSPEEQALIGGKPLEMQSQRIDGTNTFKTTATDPMTGEIVDTAYVNRIKEKLGVDDLSKVDISAIDDPELKRQAVTAKVYDSSQETLGVYLEESAKNRQETVENHQNIIRDEIRQAEETGKPIDYDRIKEAAPDGMEHAVQQATGQSLGGNHEHKHNTQSAMTGQQKLDFRMQGEELSLELSDVDASLAKISTLGEYEAYTQALQEKNNNFVGKDNIVAEIGPKIDARRIELEKEAELAADPKSKAVDAIEPVAQVKAVEVEQKDPMAEALASLDPKARAAAEAAGKDLHLAMSPAAPQPTTPTEKTEIVQAQMQEHIDGQVKKDNMPIALASADVAAAKAPEATPVNAETLALARANEAAQVMGA